jgi:hypothetical protein
MDNNFRKREATTDGADNTDVWGAIAVRECRRALSIGWTHVDYHYAFDGIIEPVGDCIVTDDFNLSELERGILISIVAFSPRPVPQAVNELHDLLSLTATFRHDLKQINIQIDLVGLHRQLFSV